MRLYDMNSEKEYTLAELKKEWQELRKEDSVNHSEKFTIEFYEILMATVNGRNDCEIVGLTAKETSNYILSIRSVINGRF